MSEGVVALALLTIGTGAVSTLMSMLTYQQSLYSTQNRGKITALLLGAYCLSGAMWAPIYDAQFPQPQQFGDYCLTIGLVALILGIVMVAATGDWINPFAAKAAAVPATPVAAAPAFSGSNLGTPGASSSASERAWDALAPHETPHLEKEAAALGVPVAFLATVAGGEAKAPSAAEAAHPSPPSSDDGPPATVMTVVLCLSPLSLRFWLLWLPVFVVLGAAFVLGAPGGEGTHALSSKQPLPPPPPPAVNNTALIVDAYQDPGAASGVIQQITVIFGICNAVSRVGGGWITDLLSARGWSRLWLLVVSCILAILGCAVLSLGGADGLQMRGLTGCQPFPPHRLTQWYDGGCRLATFFSASLTAFALPCGPSRRAVRASRWRAAEQTQCDCGCDTPAARSLPSLPPPPAETFGKKRYGRFYGLTNVAVGAGSVVFK